MTDFMDEYRKMTEKTYPDLPISVREVPPIFLNDNPIIVGWTPVGYVEPKHSPINADDVE